MSAPASIPELCVVFPVFDEVHNFGSLVDESLALAPREAG